MKQSKLLEAANKLEALAVSATQGQWEAYRGEGVSVSHIFEDTSTRMKDARYIAAVSPPFGHAVAAWLREASETDKKAAAVARVILDA